MEQPQLQPQPQPPQLPPPPASAALSLPLMLPPPQAEPPTVVDDAKSLQRKENERVDASPTTQRADGIRKGSTVLVRFPALSGDTYTGTVVDERDGRLLVHYRDSEGKWERDEWIDVQCDRLQLAPPCPQTSSQSSRGARQRSTSATPQRRTKRKFSNDGGSSKPLHSTRPSAVMGAAGKFFKSGEQVACPSCKKQLKAPQSAYALRCPECRVEITAARVHSPEIGHSEKVAEESARTPVRHNVPVPFFKVMPHPAGIGTSDAGAASAAASVQPAQLPARSRPRRDALAKKFDSKRHTADRAALSTAWEQNTLLDSSYGGELFGACELPSGAECIAFQLPATTDACRSTLCRRASDAILGNAVGSKYTAGHHSLTDRHVLGAHWQHLIVTVPHWIRQNALLHVQRTEIGTTVCSNGIVNQKSVN